MTPKTVIVILSISAVLLALYLMPKLNTNSNQIKFANNTEKRLFPDTEWLELKWNWTNPLYPTYLIDNYYINIIETVLLRRPWSNKMHGTAHDFYSIQHEIPISRDYMYYLYDYRCIIGGDVYFDSRYITNIKGPYYKETNSLKHTRTFEVHGYIQSVPFEDNHYESICSDYKNRIKLENGNTVQLPYSDKIYFTVNITEYWSKFTAYHVNMECNKVTFNLFDVKMYPGFSTHYKNLIAINMLHLDHCGDCIWNKLMNDITWTEYVKRTNNESLWIKPGRAVYIVFPDETWPSFDKGFPKEKISRELPANDFTLRFDEN